MNGSYEIRMAENELEIHLYSHEYSEVHEAGKKGQDGEVVLSFRHMTFGNYWFIANMYISNPEIEETRAFAMEVLRRLDGKDIDNMKKLMDFLDEFLVPMGVEPVGNA